MDAIRNVIDRAVNELPTIAAGAAAVLYVFGTEVSQADLDQAVEHVEALVGFGLWLFVRSRTDGPVTKARKSAPQQETPTAFVHWQDDSFTMDDQ